MNLNEYFERIEYGGSCAPTLETLHALTQAHATTIPFENLDVLLGRPIVLDEETLFRKLVLERRGGYCFEQNSFFLAVLKQLGFAAVPLSARVRVDRPRDFTPPRTHVFIRVEIDDESWLTDLGIGGLSLTQAIRLNTDEAQATPHEMRRIVREKGILFHQAKLGAVWSDVCEFTLEEMPQIDREIANWYTSTHPNSSFKNRLIASRAGKNGTRLTLLNDELKIRSHNGDTQITKITSSEDLLAYLETHFGLRFPSGTRFGAANSPWPT